jgi:SPP1 family phage portal protein
MSIDIAPDKIAGLWLDDPAITKRSQYFHATHTVADLVAPRIDGRAKTQDKTNWVRYIIQRHAGFLTSRPVTYLPSGDDPRDGVNYLAKIYRERNLAANDGHLLSDALLYGKGIELFTMQGTGTPIIRACDATEWRIIRDESLEIVAALRRTEIQKGTYYRGALLAANRVVFTVYTDSEIIRYETAKDAIGKSTMREFDREPHKWGVVPVVEYTALRNGESFISDALLRKCDNYDISRSALIDDIKHNVDALLVTEGIDYTQLLEKDDHGRSVLEKLKAVGLLPLPKDAKASYLQRVVDIEKFRFDQKTTRAEIHLMGCLPDLDETIAGNDGTITSISGVALKLMFQLMLEQSAEFSRNFERGLRRRIELIDIPMRFDAPKIGDVQIQMNSSLPFADTEFLQYLPNLDGLLTREDKLRLLPFVTDPGGASERYEAEILNTVNALTPDAPEVETVMP